MDRPCAEAGIEVGDMFLELNGKNVFNLPHKDIVSIFQTAGTCLPCFVILYFLIVFLLLISIVLRGRDSLCCYSECTSSPAFVY